jgi:hypothetical protein
MQRFTPVIIALFFIKVFLISFRLSAQQAVIWQPPYVGAESSVAWLSCENCFSSEENGLPVLVININHKQPVASVILVDEVFKPLDSIEKAALLFADFLSLSENILPVLSVLGKDDLHSHQISFTPLRRNPENGTVEKLVSFNFEFEEAKSQSATIKNSFAYSNSSILAAGDWYRLSVSQNGIHQLTYSDMAAMGINVNGLSSSLIRVHGYGGGMLPERADSPRNDDLPEVPVMVIDGGDGTFDQGDYILFYAQGTEKWDFNSQTGLFNHRKHLYSDYSFYFLSVNSGAGSRMMEFPQPASPAGTVITDYDWFYAYHPDEFSLVKSGKEWFGDLFDIVTSRNFTLPTYAFSAENEMSIRLSVAARSTSSTSFTLTAGEKTFTSFVSPITTEANTAYARMTTETFKAAASSALSSVNLKYNKNSGSALGWLNFIEINTPAALNFSGGMMNFRKSGVEGVVEYRFTGSGQVSQLWDVSNPLQPGFIKIVSAGNGFQFKALSDSRREYVLSDNASFLKPQFVEKVANQNLHGLGPHTMVIIAHPDFADQAFRLAEFHASHNDFSVLVVQPQTIYNEFSSGAQDISAIRDFVRMLWKKSGSGSQPRFLLLFGDASYDYKDYLTGNSNFIPTFQSVESLHPVTSYATDDFFGCLDDAEGGLSTDVVDIGVGRLVVQTEEQAKNAVDKIIHYATATNKVHGEWRNVIAFVADDEDGNEHMRQADQLATMIDTTYSNYNTEKIFLDAYPQISTPGGQRAPSANLAINQRMEKGALIVNYTGHGGETGWAHERVLEVNDVLSWTNFDRMPVFMTATCEFSRYDDPLRVSAGEMVFLNQKGGGVALFTTARPTFGTPNFNLARNFYNIALKPDNNGMPFLGDLIRISKRLSGSDNNGKKFVLLGDPALKMAYPQFKIYTTSINGNPVSALSDTLRAMEEVTITGFVGDADGIPLTDFSGVITPTVFDKETLIETLGSDGASRMTFSVRKNIIYKGKALVENGFFSISFIVPRDIAYQFGKGKISYYASDGVRDAAGNYDSFIIGGISNIAITDQSGPAIRLFINDTLFRSGGFTDENPVLIAYVNDESGVNTIGSSIGHDIVAVLNSKTDLPYILNDYYEADLNTFKSGRIAYPFKQLEPGKHTVRVKVWDVNNNSSEASIEFFVSSSSELTLGSFELYPNPFNEMATFVFEHNKASENLELNLGIYSLAGMQVASLNRTIFADGYRSVAFEWDGRSINGNQISAGFYVGRLRVRDTLGNESFSSVKISIVR